MMLDFSENRSRQEIDILIKKVILEILKCLNSVTVEHVGKVKRKDNFNLLISFGCIEFTKMFLGFELGIFSNEIRFQALLFLLRMNSVVNVNYGFVLKQIFCVNSTLSSPCDSSCFLFSLVQWARQGYQGCEGKEETFTICKKKDRTARENEATSVRSGSSDGQLGSIW